MMGNTMVRELMRREEVEERFGVSRSWIYCEMRAGRFPEPVKIGQARREMAGGGPRRVGCRQARLARRGRRTLIVTGARGR